jgi:hypothetical protein
MATLIEKYATEEQRSAVRILWAKGLSAKDIHKEMFPDYGGKCLLLKAVHTWVEKFSHGRSKVAGSRPGAEMTGTTFKRLRRCVFRLTGKAMEQVYQCWWRICQETKIIFDVRIYHILLFTSICDLFADSHRTSAALLMAQININRVWTDISSGGFQSFEQNESTRRPLSEGHKLPQSSYRNFCELFQFRS